MKTEAKAIPLLLLGGGGHARVVIDALITDGRELIGVLDPELAVGSQVGGVPVLGDDGALLNFQPEEVGLVNGIGSIGDLSQRRRTFDVHVAKGFEFATVVHPTAVIADDVAIAEGGQVMAGVIAQPGTRIGRNSIVNSGAIVDHDCVIMDHVHVAPGVTLSGHVFVGEGTHIGTGACVINGVRIGRAAVVGAGSVVVEDIPDGVVAIGTPARWRDSG